jgi:hypothetical protein
LSDPGRQQRPTRPEEESCPTNTEPLLTAQQRGQSKRTTAAAAAEDCRQGERIARGEEKEEELTMPSFPTRPLEFASC